MLFDLLAAPIIGPFTGLTWIGEKILEQTGGEMDELEVLQKQLLALQLSFDMGDIGEEDFEAQEEDLLMAIDAMQEAQSIS
jgi:hypothetical protein